MPVDRFSRITLGTNLTGTDQGDGELLIDAAGGGGGDFEVIADSTLGGDATSFDFTSIPGTYAHLALILFLRSDRTATVDWIGLRFNNDTGNNYTWQRFFGVNTTVTASASASVAYINAGICPDQSATSGHFGFADIIIPDYANSSYRKVAKSNNHGSITTAVADQIVGFYSGMWNSAAAITRVTVFPAAGGTNWKVGSRATLYGVSV